MVDGIKIINLNRSYKLNEAFTKKLAVKILKIIKKNNVELELVFLDDRSIKKLNKKYRGENSATDVLGFRIDRTEFGQKPFLGEIFISLDTARRNSRVFGTRFEDELILYVIHGILHLFGYDDETAPQRTRMSKKQERILKELCRRENLLKVLMPR